MCELKMLKKTIWHTNLVLLFVITTVVLPAVAADDPGKCPACSFSAVQQPYDAVRLALTADKLLVAKGEAAKLGRAAHDEAVWAKQATGRGPELFKPWSDVAAAAAKIETALSLTDARNAFGLASEAMRAALVISEGDDLLVVYCPMVKKHWLQPKGEIRNPYGPKMATCGQVVKR